MRLTTRFALIVLASTVIPAITVGMVGLSLMKDAASDAMDTATVGLFEAEKARLASVADDQVAILGSLLGQYEDAVENLRHQAESGYTSYPIGVSKYLSNLYPYKDTAGLQACGYVDPKWGAFANWDRIGYEGSVWMRKSIVEKVRRDNSFRTAAKRDFSVFLPIVPGFSAVYEQYKGTCELVWMVFENGYASTYPNDYAERLKVNPGFNELNESNEDYVRLFDTQHNPTRKTGWMPPYLDPIKHIWMTSVQTPVYDGKRFVGTLGIDITTAGLSRLLEQRHVGKSGYAFMLSQDGVPMAFQEEAITDIAWYGEQRSALSHMLNSESTEMWTQGETAAAQLPVTRNPDKATREVFSKILKDKRGIVTLKTKSGDRLVAFSTLPNTNWVVAVAMPINELFGINTKAKDAIALGARSGMESFAGSIAILALIAGLVGAWVGHRVAQPIKRLSDSVNQLGRGEDWHEVSFRGNDEISTLAINMNRMVKTILEQRSRIESVLNGVHDAIFLHDETGRIRQVNQSACDLFGFSREELLNGLVADISAGIPPYSQVEALEWLDRARAGETPLFEWHARKKSGELFWVEVNMSSIVMDNEAWVVVAVRDIKNRKQLEERTSRLAIVVEQSSDQILLSDIAGKIIYVNPALEKEMGYSYEELVGNSVAMLSKNECVDSEILPKEVKEHLKTHGTWHGRRVNITKDGREVILDTTLAVIKEKGGAIVGIAAMRRDLTKELEMESYLARAQKMEAIGTLAGGIAHDFNNILSAIIGFTELAMYETNDQSLRNHLDSVLQASGRATELVRQILAFSRMEQEEARPIIPKTIITEAIKLLRASIPSTIKIAADINSEAAVIASSSEIHRIVINLCTNASLAMRETGGLLTIKLEDFNSDAELLARTPTLIPGRYMRLTVSDTGCGMSDNVKSRIFDPFFTTRDQGEGTGMGLAVVHGIVSSRGGAILVSSFQGSGSTFEVILPISRDDSFVEAKDELEPKHGMYRILLVDDEDMILDFNQQALVKLGNTVTACRNGMDAIGEFYKDPMAFDVVVSDMTMPGMTGDLLALKIHAIRNDIPIILCTGYSERIDAEKALQIGVAAFLLKPVTPSQLLRAIASAVEPIVV